MKSKLILFNLTNLAQSTMVPTKLLTNLILAVTLGYILYYCTPCTSWSTLYVYTTLEDIEWLFAQNCIIILLFLLNAGRVHTMCIVPEDKLLSSHFTCREETN